MTDTELVAIIPGTVVKLPGLLRQRNLATLTQEQLAQVAGVQRQTIGRIEQGGEASLRTVRALARALGCSTRDLMESER